MRVCAAFVVFSVAAPPIAHAADDRVVSLHLPTLGPDERVTAFTIEWRGAHAIALPHVPAGWTLHLDNGTAARGALTASVIVGAAALEAGELRDLVRLTRTSDDDGVAFALRGRATIADYGGRHRRSRVLALAGDAFDIRGSP